jgi:MioC protein
MREADRISAGVTIIVGTMTGTADMVAEAVQEVLAERGIAARIVPMDGLDERVFDGSGSFLICSSTYGQGDVPDNGRAFFERLETVRPDLSHLDYGLIGLGDRTYAQTYCAAGRRFDALLTALGARRIGEALLHDASAGTFAEDVARDWAGPWAEACRDALRRAA